MRFETDVKEFHSALARCAKVIPRKNSPDPAAYHYVKFHCRLGFVFLTALDGAHLVEIAVPVQNATAGGGVYDPKHILSGLKGYSGTLRVTESDNGDGSLHLFCAGLQLVEPRFCPMEEFPNTDRMLEPDFKIPFEVGFNAQFLADTALACAGDDGVVRLRMESNGKGPMIIDNRTTPDRGIVCPFRLG